MLVPVLLLGALTFTSPTLAQNPHQCCIANGVSAACAKMMCNPGTPPSDAERYSALDMHTKKSCYRFLPDIAQCLADGRDSTPCCHRTAERTDLSACFDICRGQAASTKITDWPQYRSCLFLNLSPMMECMNDAYSSHPSPPQNLRISDVQRTSVVLRWDKPEKRADKAKMYKIYLEANGERTVIETTNTEVTLSALSSEKMYTLRAVSLGSEGVSSTSTPILSFSTQSAVLPHFKEVVRVEQDQQKVSLPCWLQNSLLEDSRIVWTKEINGKFERLLGGKVTSYFEPINGTYDYMSAIEIEPLTSQSFGRYRCHVENDFTQYGEVKLEAFSFTESEIPPAPRQTPIECCSKHSPAPGCESVCSDTADKTEVKPGAFLPKIQCQDEFNTLMKCTLQEMNNLACCIREQIPLYCLGLCDSRFFHGSIFGIDCMMYTSKVYICQEETTRLLPYGVSKLKATGDDSTANVEWGESELAEVYHVYHRKNKGVWKTGATSRISSVVHDADEIALVAVNKHGYSTSTRIRYKNGQWNSQYLY